ncbi:hypothetical protein IQ244_07210 [Nostoc sp. LEGE 06077]|nr:hypothetical protein [Nostoc sp. LEGE 06077]
MQYQDSTLKNQAIADKERLNLWAITRLLSDMQRVTVAKFHTRFDEDGQVQLLRKLIPDAKFMVFLDCQREEIMI